MHVPAAHHCDALQSASVVQTLPHAPVVRLQMVPARPAQSALLVHFAQAPAAVQYGWLVVGHGRAPAAPKSTVHVAQALPEHTGFAPGHCV